MHPRNETIDEQRRTGDGEQPGEHAERTAERAAEPTDERTVDAPPATGSGADPGYHSPGYAAGSDPSGTTRVDSENPSPADAATEAHPAGADWVGPGVAPATERPAGETADWAGPTGADSAAARTAEEGADWTSPTAVAPATEQTAEEVAEERATDRSTTVDSTAVLPPPEAMPTATDAGTGGFVLLSDEDRGSFRRRWRDVQTGFVDDPRESVQQASDLVGEAVQTVTSRLTEHWQGIGPDYGDAATEELRQELRRYRALFDRLLDL